LEYLELGLLFCADYDKFFGVVIQLVAMIVAHNIIIREFGTFDKMFEFEPEEVPEGYFPFFGSKNIIFIISQDRQNRGSSVK